MSRRRVVAKPAHGKRAAPPPPPPPPPAGALARRCRACGAKEGQPCRAIARGSSSFALDFHHAAREVSP